MSRHLANEPPAFTIDAVVDENTTAVLTLAAVDPEGGGVDFALSGGEDQDLFTVSGDQLAFTAAPDFEVPTDADGNNVYLVQVTATDEAGGATTQDLSITVANDPAEEPPSPVEPFEVAALDFLLLGWFRCVERRPVSGWERRSHRPPIRERCS